MGVNGSIIVYLITSLLLLSTTVSEFQEPPKDAKLYSDSPSTAPSSSSSVVPALFVIGDSSVDSGTNNYLGTFARADHLPYGRDFDTHQPTGRFSNGRIPVDYLALRLGLPFVPSYLGQKGAVEDMMHGVNYASAGAGIILSSGSELGQHISFTQQIQQFTDTLQQIILSVGEDVATTLVSNSVFYVSIGINDYIHYYLLNVSNVDNLYPPWRFNQFLASSLRQEIKVKIPQLHFSFDFLRSKLRAFRFTISSLQFVNISTLVI
ncbi:GDSL esterase/lipase At5g08460-like [Abrus precatorius]|uniref:GDSL esterase/lipase At5g08460-like n=1 Tax=Abrus precatorius TaxID=3816 RepID=A0A8B8M210_ABRPR|nr:GDSL esterase/lipase At5g08460-like [Abrus precatorius]